MFAYLLMERTEFTVATFTGPIIRTKRHLDLVTLQEFLNLKYQSTSAKETYNMCVLGEELINP